MSNTGCQCQLSGFCDRHKIHKNPHYHHLCQTNQKYFDLWEQCRGPGQEFINCTNESISRPAPLPPKKSCNCNTKIEEPQPTQEELKANLPSTWEQVKSYTKSTIKHIANGMKKTPEELQKERLAICAQCPLFIQDSNRCGKCGCFLPVKTARENEKCPENRW